MAATVQGADQSDRRTLVTAAEQVDAAHATRGALRTLEEIVADKGYASKRDDGRLGRGGPAVVHFGTRPWPARSVRRAGCVRAQLWESPPPPGHPWAMLAAANGRTRGAIICPLQ